MQNVGILCVGEEVGEEVQGRTAKSTASKASSSGCNSLKLSVLTRSKRKGGSNRRIRRWRKIKRRGGTEEARADADRGSRETKQEKL